MRDYSNLDRYVTQLQEDIYPQPPDLLHQFWGEWIINQWSPLLTGTKDNTVLDVGCGQGQFYPAFRANSLQWVGVTLGTDYDVCLRKGYEVYRQDFSFLEFPDDSFGTVFSRHSLEHSPFPILTLMEWNRVSQKYLILVLPNPDHFQFFGKNHYGVMTNAHALWLAARAGWKPFQKDYTEKQELRYLFEKAEPRTELMWESESRLEEEYGSHR